MSILAVYKAVTLAIGVIVEVVVTGLFLLILRAWIKSKVQSRKNQLERERRIRETQAARLQQGTKQEQNVEKEKDTIPPEEEQSHNLS